MAPLVDPVAFPQTAAFVAALPRGLDSHPECEVKASVLREMIPATPSAVVEALPPPVRELVVNPPPVNVWVSEVKVNVLLRASIEELAQRTGDPDAMMAVAYTSTHKLLSTPLYKVLFLLVSPDRLMVGLDKRWAALRRGTRIELIDRAEGAVRLRLHYPERHYDRAILRVRTASLRAAVTCSGARDATVDLDRLDRGSADFVVRWT